MTAKEKRMFDRIKSIVEDMMREKEEGTYVEHPIDSLIEDAYMQLNLDYTFNPLELKRLKVAHFKVNKNHTEATRVYKKVPLKLFKNNMNFYTLTLGKGRKGHFVDLDDLDEAYGKDLDNFVEDYLGD